MAVTVNRVILAGNLTRDPQVKFLANEKAVANFGLAINNRFKAADGTDWIVYHAKTTSEYTYRGRTTRVQPFTWNEVTSVVGTGVPQTLTDSPAASAYLYRVRVD